MGSKAIQPDGTMTVRIAIGAELLYLGNLLLLPLLAFFLLLWLAWYSRDIGSSLAQCHIDQALNASIWALLLLLPPSVLILAISGLDSPGGWMAVILYMVCCHTSLVLAGVIGLARAFAGKCYRYPLFGLSCAGCT